MKKNRIIELVVKVAVAALTAFLTALGTTSCMGNSLSNLEPKVGEEPCGQCACRALFFLYQEFENFSQRS